MRIFKIQCALFVVFGWFFSTVFSTTVFSKGNYSPEIQKIVDRGKLVVAMYSKDTPPFYYMDDQSELAGVDVELIKGFGRLLGVDVEFDRSARSFNEVVDKVANREADLAICKLSITFSRAQRVLFTEPYIVLRQGLLINRLLLASQLKGRSREETVQSLKGKIGVIGNSSYVGYAKRRFKDMEIVEYPSWGKVVEAVVAGEIVAAYRDEAEIKKIIRDHPDSAVKLLTVVLKDAKDPKGIAVSWDSPNLKALLEFYVRSMGLELTASNVLYEYENLIDLINRNTK